MRGIDISNWQAGISPSAIPVDFVIVKATEGIGFTDACCDSFVQDCINSGKLWGFYHFARENEPEQEAQYFYDECRGYFSKGIPVLDYETSNYDNREWCERFLNKLHELSGIWAMLYISASRCGEYETSWIPDKCGLWVAGYPWDNPNWIDDSTSIPYNIYPWNFAAIWQFTSGLDIPEWGERLDANIAYMDSEGWMKYAQSTNNPEPINSPTPSRKTIDDYAFEVILGEYGNGEDRKRMLGNKYNEVQARVNELYNIADEVINGEWGNGVTREYALEEAGYPYSIVQYIVNSILM